MISEETIQRVAEANDIVDVIGSYVKLQRAGTRFRALCPFHNEKSPSFFVSPDRQAYHCFGCGAGGNTFRFVMEHEHVDFPTAVRRLAERAGIPIVEEAMNREEAAKLDLRKRLLALHQAATTFFHHNLLKARVAARAREYLQSRGMTSEVAKEWMLGYAPDSWDSLLSHLRSAGYKEPELMESGLFHSKEGGSGRIYDRFRNRLMFPICNDTGEAIAFSGRVLDSDAKEAKYVNSPETKIFTKGRVLFGLHKSKRDIIREGHAIVCEGQIDTIAIFESGIRNVIAPQGTAFTPDHARILKRLTDNVVLCFDSDTAGQKAMERSFDVLLADDIDVRIAELPESEDPDSLIRGGGIERFRGIVASAPDFFDYRIRRAKREGELNTPRGKVNLAKELMASAARIAQPALRDQIVERLAVSLNIGGEQLRRMVRQVPVDTGATTRSTPQIPLPGEDVRQLVQIVMESPEAAAWLRSRKPDLVAEEIPETAVLWKVLKLLPPGAAGTDHHALRSQLTAEEEAALTRIMENPLPKHEGQAEACWHSLERKAIHRRTGSLKAALSNPELAVAEMLRLQKEVLDLRAMLADISRPAHQNSATRVP